MNHAQAAQAALYRFADELSQSLARFLAPHSVQVDLSLHDPVAAPQFSHDFLAHARAAIGERFVSVEQDLGVELVGNRLVQHGFFVEPGLHWQRRRRIARQRCARRHRERRYFADFAAKQIGVCSRFALCSRRGCAFTLAPLAVDLQRIAQRAQARQTRSRLDCRPGGGGRRFRRGSRGGAGTLWLVRMRLVLGHSGNTRGI